LTKVSKLAAHSLPSYERFLDLILEYVPLDLIIEFMATEAERERVQDLLERKSAATITPAELDELDDIVQFDQMVMRLKARAYVLKKERD